MIVNFQRLGKHTFAQLRLGGVSGDARSRAGGPVAGSVESEHSAQASWPLYAATSLKDVADLGTQHLGTQLQSQSQTAGLADVATPAKANKDKEGDKLSGVKKQRKSQIDHSLEQGRDVQKAAQAMDWGAHWGKQMRKREFDTMRGRLGNHARKLASYVDHTESADLSFQLFAAEEQLVARQDFIESIRSNFVELASSDLSQPHLTLLKDAPPALLCTILTQKAQTIIDEIPAAKDAAAHCAIFIGVIVCTGQQITGPPPPHKPANAQNRMNSSLISRLLIVTGSWLMTHDSRFMIHVLSCWHCLFKLLSGS